MQLVYNRLQNWKISFGNRILTCVEVYNGWKQLIYSFYNSPFELLTNL